MNLEQAILGILELFPQVPADALHNYVAIKVATPQRPLAMEVYDQTVQSLVERGFISVQPLQGGEYFDPRAYSLVRS